MSVQHARVTEIGGTSAALGARVMLDLAERYTVLVGRNAAGKSALLRTIADGALGALGGRLDTWEDLTEFECLAQIGSLTYQYTGRRRYVVSADEASAVPVWSESCTEVGANNRLWESDAGIIQGTGSEHVSPADAGLLVFELENLPEPIAAVASAFKRLFTNMRFVPAGLPRRQQSGPRFMYVDPKLRRRGSARGGRDRLDALTERLVDWHSRARDKFDDVQEVLQRLGICRTLGFAETSFGEDRTIAMIDLDGLNIGVASDGTLRTIEMVVALQEADAEAFVMIEEPECGVHPGLADRILAEFDAAAHDLQLVVSTHSPRIVDRVEYTQLRHVRRNGATELRSLSPEEVDGLKMFLSHHGTLGEFVFSDDFEPDDDDESDDYEPADDDPDDGSP